MGIFEALEKHQENRYKEYIYTHKLNVQKSWDNMKNNSICMELISDKFMGNINIAIQLIDELIKNHDNSKLSPEEFNAYRKEHYPVSPEEKEANKENYEKAWKHHYHNNMHHWDWWYENNLMDSMPFANVVEMICDWEAVGYFYGTSTKEWYIKNKHEIHLGEKQRRFVEDLIDAFCK